MASGQTPGTGSGPCRGEGRRLGGTAELGQSVDPCASPPRCGQKATFGDPESPHPACSPLAVPPVQQSIRDGRAGAGPCSCSAAERGPTGPVLLPAFTCSPCCPHAEGFVPRPVLLPPLSRPIPPAGPAPSDPRGPRSRWGRAGAAQLSPASLNFKAALVCRATESFPSYIQTIGPDPAVAGKQ